MIQWNEPGCSWPKKCSCLSDGSPVRPEADVSRKRKGPTFVTEELQHSGFVVALNLEASRVATHGALKVK
jgi:hypothetical protein